MQVQLLPLYNFLEGTGKSFVIPVYQRDYTWTKVNCQKLWEDLVDLNNNNNNRNNHFLGTLVTISKGFEEYTVIDGQQRLTTVSILLIALHRYLKNKEGINKEEERLMNILLDFLIDTHSLEQDKRIRLKPNKQDKEHFENLFTGNTSNINSNIVNNYDFFLKKISAETLTTGQIYESFKKLTMVLITLDRGQDEPQLIFESLNSTGVDLTAGDLVRNYILMDLEPFEQERMYKNYWVKIENLTGDIAEFVRNYLMFKLKVWVKKADAYPVFKNFSIVQYNKNKESILQDLLSFAEIFSWFVQIKKHQNNNINRQLARLKRLEFTVCYPYLFDVFNDVKSGNIDEETAKNVLVLIESYAFRKIIVDNTTQGLNKLFISLGKDIKKEQYWNEQYLNILCFILLGKRVSQRFPNDEEFENALINKEVYRLQVKNRNFLLGSLENYKSAYAVNLDELTVEHIMPQTLTNEWKKKLGENWQDTHKKYLHTLGNLSLTAKNPELSNNLFEDKQQIDFKNSKLNLNLKLEGLTVWNEEKILERANDLIKKAKDIWSYPKTTYSKSIPEEQNFDLTSEDNFSGSKPTRLYFESEERQIELKTWRDLLVKTCIFLYDYSPTQFNELQNSPEFKFNFDVDKPLRNPLEFRPNEFVEGNTSANAIIALLLKMCERLNYQPENIQFSIKNLK